MLLFLYFINFNYVISETTDQRCSEKKKKKKKEKSLKLWKIKITLMGNFCDEVFL